MKKANRGINVSKKLIIAMFLIDSNLQIIYEISFRLK